MVDMVKVFEQHAQQRKSLVVRGAKYGSDSMQLQGLTGIVSPTYSVSRTVEIDWRAIEQYRCIGFIPEAEQNDYYKMLRAQISKRLQAINGNTMMITSLHPGEGKTLTAINLSAMFAKEFHRTVLLVDADLRKQSIQHYFGFKGHRGLGDYLLDSCPIEDIIVWPQIEKLTLISGGKTFTESAELLNSLYMRALAEEMKNRYKDRYVIFDVPHLLGMADAVEFSSSVDGIIIVVAEGKTPQSDVRRALSLIPRNKILGFVFNKT
ncbi:MAG: AAA family ATPase [Desulfobacteraceae bacterium]|nr:AAA family ATPase [Desulfobacteraceae bacterium]